MNLLPSDLRLFARRPAAGDLHVVVHPFAGLSAQTSGFHQFGQQRGGPVFIAQLPLQALDAQVDHIESRGVGRLEGTDGKPQAKFARPVDLLGRANPLLQQEERLVQKRNARAKRDVV